MNKFSIQKKIGQGKRFPIDIPANEIEEVEGFVKNEFPTWKVVRGMRMGSEFQAAIEPIQTQDEATTKRSVERILEA